MDDKTRTELEAAAFRRLVAHLQERTDVQNIDLMNLAGFCRNCLSRWYREEAGSRGIEIADPKAREIAFCSSRHGAQRTTIHELDETTFDLGIGAPHVDMMVRLRLDDAATRTALREGVGQPLLAPGNPAGAAIGHASPTRVFASALARLEVHQPIPPPGGRSPEGPHSHLLPHYLKEGRAHAPGSPLPAGLWCGLSLYPRTRL